MSVQDDIVSELATKTGVDEESVSRVMNELGLMQVLSNANGLMEDKNLTTISTGDLILGVKFGQLFMHV